VQVFGASLYRNNRECLRTYHVRVTVRGVPLLSRVACSEVSAEPPREFRLFAHGVNKTSKGDFLLDEAAIASIMRFYKLEGVDMMIDLEHHSLDADARARVDAADARGWFQLEVRNDGLWAVNVRWTPDGEQRLREKRQRYTSPAFEVDEDGRIMRILNTALVAMPATYNAPALIAARRAWLNASFQQVTDAVSSALRDLLVPAQDPSCAVDGPYVCDLYEGSAIYQFDGSLFAITYSHVDGVVTFTGQPVKVVRQYVPAQQAALARAKRYLEKVKKHGSR
jgi:hypothetical protein